MTLISFHPFWDDKIDWVGIILLGSNLNLNSNVSGVIFCPLSKNCFSENENGIVKLGFWSS